RGDPCRPRSKVLRQYGRMREHPHFTRFELEPQAGTALAIDRERLRVRSLLGEPVAADLGHVAVAEILRVGELQLHRARRVTMDAEAVPRAWIDGVCFRR